MEMKFYQCSHCKKIIAVVKESGVPIICCGEKMSEIIPNTQDASLEKHIPVAEQKGNIVSVKVGSTDHPMEDNHHIEWIAVETEYCNQRKVLKAGDDPEAEFSLLDGDSIKAVYSFCNIHGLWKA